MSGYVTGQSIKAKNIDQDLEIVFVDNLLQECTCIELYGHDAKPYKVKFDDIVEG